MELSVTSRQEGDRTVIAVAGEIDVYTAPSLRERLNELVASGHYDLVVDMEGVEFLDSTGLGVLQDSHARRQEVSRRIIFLRGGRTDGALSDGELDSLLPFAD